METGLLVGVGIGETALPGHAACAVPVAFVGDTYTYLYGSGDGASLPLLRNLTISARLSYSFTSDGRRSSPYSS
jgi:hypothetical protein